MANVTYFQVVTTTISVTLSIIMAYVFQSAIVLLGGNDDIGQLIFSISLPLVLISSQAGLKIWRLRRSTHETVIYKIKLQTETLNSLNQLRHWITKSFREKYDVKEFDFYVLDWQRNVHVNISSHGKKSDGLAIYHPLVYFATQYRMVYSTERYLIQEDTLNDPDAAEIMEFMRRHSYVLAVPMLTHTEVVGFIFFTLTQIKDTKLFALEAFDDLVSLGTQFGPLLYKIILYDSIVLKQN